MYKYFIAITNPGSEYMFKKSDVIAVPAASANKIIEALNRIQYKLKPGEVWKLYENDFYYNTLINSVIKSYSPHKSIKLHRFIGV